MAMSEETLVWYVHRPEIRSGALRLADLKRLARSGALKPKDLVWHQGWDKWIPAESVSDLNPDFGSATAEKVTVSAEPITYSHAEGSSNIGTIKQKLIHEIVSYAAITAFLLIVLLLLKMYEQVVLDRYGIRPDDQSSLIVNALVLGKVILIAEVIRLGNRVSTIAPIFSIVIRSFLFALALFAFHVLEDILIAYWHGNPPFSGLSDFENYKQDLAVVTIMTIALLPYHAFKELQNATGNTKLISHLFGSGSGT